MVVLVSACLLGENCKYSGGNNYSALLAELLRGHTVLSVCPEQLGGLPTPRPCVELVRGVATDCNGRNVEDAFRTGAARALALAKEHHADCAVLQPRSPSCGIGEIYDGSFTGRKIPGSGVFAAALCEAGFPACNVSDEATLRKMLGGETAAQA